MALIAVLVIAYVLVTYAFGFAIMSISGVILLIAVVMLFKGFTGWADYIKRPSKSTAKVLGLVLLALTAFMYGMFGLPSLGFTWESITGGVLGTTAQLNQPVSMSEVETIESVTVCRTGLSDELLDDKASVMLNAYDVEASAGYGTAVDLSSNCWQYSNGNQPRNFVSVTSDTSDNADTDVWNVGDAVYLYCGGTSYYTEPIEGLCVNSPNFPLVIRSHGFTTAATGVDASAYDDDGNALTAAGNTSTADYDITLGAAETKTFDIKWKQSVSRTSYNFAAIATASFNDIEHVKPIAGQGFMKVTEPNYLRTIAVSDAVGGGNQSLTYDLYIYDPDGDGQPNPILLSQYEHVRFTFEILSGSDPSATDNVFSTLDAGIVCSIDATYVRGADGKLYLDVHDHAVENSEGDVGWAENPNMPIGGYECVVLEGN